MSTVDESGAILWAGRGEMQKFEFHQRNDNDQSRHTQ